MKKIAPIAIIFCLIIITNVALADLIPPECAGENPPKYCKYGNYKGPLYLTFLFFNPELALFINFMSILIITFLLSYFYLGYKNIAVVLSGSAIASMIGAIIDSLSLFTASVIHDYFYSNYLFDVSGLKNVFAISLFLTSFALLGIMYFLIIYRLFKIDSKKKIILSSVILAILTNPVWLYFL